MKIRTCFVSNSSSSSFVVVAPKNAVDEIIENKTKYEKACIKHIMKQQSFNGIDVCVFSGISGNYSSWEDGNFNFDDYDDYDEKTCEYPSEVFDEFVKELKNSCKDTIYSKNYC